MGKVQKGKTNYNQKPSGKSTQRSAQNKKQLAKVDRILSHKNDRTQSKPSRDGKPQNKFGDSRGNRDSQRGRSQSFEKRGGGRDFRGGNREQRGGRDFRGGSRDFRGGSRDQRGGGRDNRGGSRGNRGGFKDFRSESRDQRGESRDQRGGSRDVRGGSREQRGGNRNQSRDQRGASEWTESTNKKTKQITKQFQGGRQPNLKKKGVFGENEAEVIKGNPLFKIIPEGMDEDAFAALGINNADDQEQQIGDSEASNGSQEYGDEEQHDEEQEGDDIQQQGDMQAEQFDEEEEQQQMMQEDGDQLEGEQQQQNEQEQQQDSDDQQDEEQKQMNEQEQQQGGQQQIDEQEGQIQLAGGQGDKEPVDISVISLKIQETIQILMNVGKLGAGKSRKEHLEDLKNLIHQYYGYNFELINHFLDFLNPTELIQFFEANETQRPLTIRTNTLKTRRKQLAQSLIQRGVNLDPLADWSNVGIKIYETKVPIGATPEYLAGHYMLQSASSFLPVVALDPQPYEKILDMASAPGGKTTYIAQLMKNTGSLFANDLKKERLRALQFNLYRLGVTNTAVTCRDGRKFGSIFPSTFDRILLDAPCTGLGIISKDPSIKATRQMIDIYKNSHLQKELLLAAIDSCKVNGTVVYSTCSVSPLENEEVVNYALKRRFIKIVECGIEVGEQGLIKFVEKRFHVDLKKTRRIYPHVHNMDGFYVAKLIKIGKGKKQVKEEQGAGQHKELQVEGQVQIE